MDSVRVDLSRDDTAWLRQRESDVILELDSRLWGGERPVDVDELRRPDSGLLADYSELYEKEDGDGDG